MTANATQQAVEETPFLDLLQLGEEAPDRFVGILPQVGWRRPFGGHLLAQTVAAAARTVPQERGLHILQTQFLRQGRIELPLSYEVARLRDAKRFSARQVTAWQDDRMLLLASLSYQRAEPGLEHQEDMPIVPGPEGLRSEQEWRRDAVASHSGEWALSPAMPLLPIEIRPVQARDFVAPSRQARLDLWIRANEPLSPHDGPPLIACISDVMLLSSALMPHALSWNTSPIEGSTLNHTLWLHRQEDLTGWMLWSLESIWTGGTRGLARGTLWHRNGMLIASAMQEGLIRRK